MTIEENDARLVYLSETNCTESKGLCNVIRDKWFCVHPQYGLIFWQSNTRKRKGSIIGAAPQCNSNELITRHIQIQMYPWAEVKQIPLVIVPIDVSDYE